MFDPKIFVTKTSNEQSLELFAKTKWQTFHFKESLTKFQNLKNVAKMISNQCKPYFEFEIDDEYLFQIISKMKTIQIDNNSDF